jgi:hypothetical protein
VLTDDTPYAWTHQQAERLRSGDLTTLDVNRLAEEIDIMGNSVQQQLESRLTVLMTHLLKWAYQPERRGRSGELTVVEQPRRVVRLMRKNPSLRSVLDEAITDAYGDAVIDAERETGLPESTFPLSALISLSSWWTTLFGPRDPRQLN